jgi:two-component system chemotaxis sensor kinase CheA
MSGRGVGMDIVMNTVRSLGGSVEVKSEKGKGTTVRLRLPLTMAIIQVLIVKVGDEKYGIPIKDIVEVKPISRCEIRSVGGLHRLITNGDSIPVIHLSEALGGHSYGERMIVVVSSFEKTLALACDAVLTQKEVVVKSLGGVLRGVRGISGVSILGEGDIIPILDVNTI